MNQAVNHVYDTLVPKVKEIIKLHRDKKDVIVKMDTFGYSVEGTKGKKYYVELNPVDDKWSCDCPAFRYEHGVDDMKRCKHINAVVYARDNGEVIRHFDDIMEEEIENE